MGEDNIKLVQSLYAAFGRGDIATLVDGLTPDVEWTSGGEKNDFPTFGTFRGRTGVQQFFAHVADTIAFSEFAPRDFYPTGDKVFVLGRYTGKIKKTGRTAGSEWVHVFTIKGGKASRFQEFTDTAAFVQAYRG